MMAGALDGYRVLDMTNFVAGPYATMLLADMGAEVIKVEAPPLGDPNRFRENDSGYSTGFAAINRNKKGLFIDFSSPRAADVFDRLLASADVLVTSIRPRSRNKLRISYEQLSSRFPRLVYCSLTGLCEKGDALDRPAFDTTAQALSGLLSLITNGLDKPVRIRALVMADRVIVMNHGVIVQEGTPEELYARPGTAFVARTEEVPRWQVR